MPQLMNLTWGKPPMKWQFSVFSLSIGLHLYLQWNDNIFNYITTNHSRRCQRLHWNLGPPLRSHLFTIFLIWFLSVISYSPRCNPIPEELIFTWLSVPSNGAYRIETELVDKAIHDLDRRKNQRQEWKDSKAPRTVSKLKRFFSLFMACCLFCLFLFFPATENAAV